MNTETLFERSAAEIIAQLRAGSLTHDALYDALESRVKSLNPDVNALVTLCFDSARARLKAEPDIINKPLAGMPLVVKDLTDTAGLLTTYASPIFADHVPVKNDILVDRLEAAGAVVIGKSNTPEFGAGANTFNEVFGATVNPHDHKLTCGGSSGGSAVAMTLNLGWFATGSDYGGSLRIPAAFCGSWGLRPGAGAIARGGQDAPSADPLCDRAVDGPMAPRLEDLALLYSAMKGRDARDPLSRDFAPQPALKRAIAYLPDFGDIIPIATQNKQALLDCVADYRAAGFDCSEVELDLEGVRDAFQTIRAFDFAILLQPLLSSHRDKLKPEVIWNVEKGLALSGAEISTAFQRRAKLTNDLNGLFETADALMTPVTAVRPFPVEQRYIEEIEGQKLENYVDWLAPTFLFSLWVGPSMSMPRGIGRDSLPDAVQLIGAVGGEETLFSVAGAV